MNDPQLQAAYTSATGQPAGRVERLPGGAGNRIYWRVHPLNGKARSAVVMELPADPAKSRSSTSTATSSASASASPASSSTRPATASW